MSEAMRLPDEVADALQRITTGGHEAHLVGRCVAALCVGELPREFELSSSARIDALLGLFPHAVVIAADKLSLPTTAGPIDLSTRSIDLAEALARRDFRRHALALDLEGRLLDPHQGLADLRSGRLSCVGSARERLAEDPLRALRALRYAATLGLEPDADLLAALPEVASDVARCPAVALRGELHALLLGAHVEAALNALRESGLERALADGVGEDAAAIVAALPLDLELRLAGWLHDARGVRALRRLREPRERVVRIERLLQLHPIDAGAAPLKRLLRRPQALVEALFELRSAEIRARGEGEAAQRALQRLREACASERAAAESSAELALDGRAVMEILGCAPGPEVGRALHQLRKAVEADPECNRPEALRARLLAWRNA